MSNDNTGQQAQQTAEQTTANQATREITALFDRVVAGGYQPRLRSVSGTCRFNIAGAGSWLATIKDGMPTVTRDDGKDITPADCTVACTAENFLRTIHREGNLNIFAAFLQGIVIITGDIGFATTLLGSVTLDTVDSVDSVGAAGA